MAKLDILIEETRWEAAGLATLAQRASDATLALLGMSANFEISLMGCDDARIAALNTAFRGKGAPTNVLSWPAVDLASEEDGGSPAPPHIDDPELGDIAIAYETCAREADEQSKTFEDHVTHLLIHGILHLLGYDHIRQADADLMEGLERRILAKLNIADPY